MKENHFKYGILVYAVSIWLYLFYRVTDLFNVNLKMILYTKIEFFFLSERKMVKNNKNAEKRTVSNMDYFKRFERKIFCI